jgi:hypothetical protein
MEQTESSETSASKIQMPGNYPEENIQHTEHGESLKSRIHFMLSSKNQNKKKFNAFFILIYHSISSTSKKETIVMKAER